MSPKEKLTRGMMVSEFCVAPMAHIAAAVGYDYIIVDCEHGSFDYRDVAVLCASARGTGLQILVRVPSISRDHIGTYLDAGADGIVAPMVSSVQQAQELVNLGTYAPLGQRGISVTRAHSGYRVNDLASYLAEANQRISLYAQIETADAVSNASDIAAVPGITGLLIGPNDLLQDIGVPGETRDSRLRNALSVVAEAASAEEKESGIITGDLELLEAGIDVGMRVLCQGSDVSLLMKGARGALSTLDSLTIG